MNQHDSDSEQDLDGVDAIREEDGDEGSSPHQDASSVIVANSSMKNRKDENLVLFSRIVVAVVLILSALIIATLAYVLLSKNQHRDFITQVRSVATGNGFGAIVPRLLTGRMCYEWSSITRRRDDLDVIDKEKNSREMSLAKEYHIKYEVHITLT